MSPENIEQFIAALQRPACYPHMTRDIELVETHISWVLLTGDFVYKIKKPVDFGFLDFSSLEKRRHFCEEELRLNRRFSQGLYLAVVPITGTVEQPLIDIEGGSEGDSGGGSNSQVLEYAVRMRQFDQSDLLDRLADDGQLTLDDMSELGMKLADFHAVGAAPLDDSAPEEMQAYGSAQQVLDSALENFTQIRPRLQEADDIQLLQRLEQWTRTEFSRLESDISTRRLQDFVRECHGDLHLGNIARIDGEITFFDCIEFNPQLRWIDTQSELAFLLMDMEEKGLHALSNRLLNVYLEFSGDYGGLTLLRFFKVYRAMVRAKVMRLQLDDGGLGAQERETAEQKFRVYMRLAQSVCGARQPFMALMHGVSGTGKSTVAGEFAMAYGAVRVRSDVERKRLFGLAADERSRPEQEQGLYSRDASDRTFARLAEVAATVLAAGFPVIVDATFLSGHRRQPFMQLAKDRGVTFVIIDCQASEATLVQRLENRSRQQRGASDADVAVMRRQQKQREAFTESERPHVLTVDTEQPLQPDRLSRLFLS